ncbi:PAS domain S-box protein [Candidatus Woesearchaeota archaeon]|nr:PAS domain S-box protein [Candidatus Woesearchaeota archaeon]
MNLFCTAKPSQQAFTRLLLSFISIVLLFSTFNVVAYHDPIEDSIEHVYNFSQDVKNDFDNFVSTHDNLSLNIYEDKELLEILDSYFGKDVVVSVIDLTSQTLLYHPTPDYGRRVFDVMAQDPLMKEYCDSLKSNSISNFPTLIDMYDFERNAKVLRITNIIKTNRTLEGHAIGICVSDVYDEFLHDDFSMELKLESFLKIKSYFLKKDAEFLLSKYPGMSFSEIIAKENLESHFTSKIGITGYTFVLDDNLVLAHPNSDFINNEIYDLDEYKLFSNQLNDILQTNKSEFFISYTWKFGMIPKTKFAYGHILKLPNSSEKLILCASGNADEVDSIVSANVADLKTNSVKFKILSVAQQVSDYISENPSKTLQDLLDDNKFRQIAIKQIGMSGFTGIADSETRTVRLSKDIVYEGVGIDIFSSNNLELVSLIDSADTFGESSGTIFWSDIRTGFSKNLYLYIKKLDVKTADGYTLGVFGRIDFDELSEVNLQSNDLFVNPNFLREIALEKVQELNYQINLYKQKIKSIARNNVLTSNLLAIEKDSILLNDSENLKIFPNNETLYSELKNYLSGVSSEFNDEVTIRLHHNSGIGIFGLNNGVEITKECKNHNFWFNKVLNNFKQENTDVFLTTGFSNYTKKPSIRFSYPVKYRDSVLGIFTMNFNIVDFFNNIFPRNSNEFRYLIVETNFEDSKGNSVGDFSILYDSDNATNPIEIQLQSSSLNGNSGTIEITYNRLLTLSSYSKVSLDDNNIYLLLIPKKTPFSLEDTNIRFFNNLFVKFNFLKIAIIFIEFTIYLFLIFSVNQDDASKKSIRNKFIWMFSFGILITLLDFISSLFSNAMFDLISKRVTLFLIVGIIYFLILILINFDTNKPKFISRIYRYYKTFTFLFLFSTFILCTFTNLIFKVPDKTELSAGSMFYFFVGIIILVLLFVLFYIIFKILKKELDKSFFVATAGIFLNLVLLTVGHLLHFSYSNTQKIFAFVLVISIVWSLFKFEVLKIKNYTVFMLTATVFSLMIFFSLSNGLFSLYNLEQSQLKSYSNDRMRSLDEKYDSFAMMYNSVNSEIFYLSKTIARDVFDYEDLITFSYNVRSSNSPILDIKFYDSENKLIFNYPEGYQNIDSDMILLNMPFERKTKNIFTNSSSDLSFSIYNPILSSSKFLGTLIYDIRVSESNNFFNCHIDDSENFMIYNDQINPVISCNNIVNNEFNDILAEKITEISKQGFATSALFKINGTNYLLSYLPAVFDDTVFHFVILSDLSNLYSEMKKSKDEIWNVTFLSILISIGFGIVVNLLLTRTLRFEIDSKTERIRDLNKHLQKMVNDKTKELENTNLELKKSNENLDKEVKHRTIELNKKVTDLENMKSALLNIMEDLRETVEDYNESRKKYKLIVDNMNDVLYMVDFNDKILSVSKNIKQLLGYSPSELMGKPITIVEPDASESSKLKNKLLTKKSLQYATKHKTRTGRLIDVSVSSRVVSSSGLGLIQSIVRDISAQKKTEEKIIKLNKNLERKVEERTKKLTAANEKVQKLFNLRSQFVNQVAHDLRTPMTPILGLIPLIRSKVKDKNSLEQINMVENNARYLSELINKTLDISRLDAGKLKLNKEKVEMSQLLKDFIRNSDELFKQNKIKVSLNIESKAKNTVFADKMRINEILFNLVSNASKFMPNKKELIFTLNVKSSKVFLSVKDSGIGISKEHIKKIFEEFYQVDTSGHSHSAGLGLAISKRIIELHGGKIWAESDGVNMGTTFTFSLPKK